MQSLKFFSNTLLSHIIYFFPTIVVDGKSEERAAIPVTVASPNTTGAKNHKRYHCKRFFYHFYLRFFPDHLMVDSKSSFHGGVCLAGPWRSLHQGSFQSDNITLLLISYLNRYNPLRCWQWKQAKMKNNQSLNNHFFCFTRLQFTSLSIPEKAL